MDVDAVFVLRVRFNALFDDEFLTPREAVEWFISEEGEGLMGALAGADAIELVELHSAEEVAQKEKP